MRLVAFGQLRPLLERLNLEGRVGLILLCTPEELESLEREFQCNDQVRIVAKHETDPT